MRIPSHLKALAKRLLDVDARRSYSQYGEDVVAISYFLGKQWRPGVRSSRRIQKSGFYVDVGAYSPTECSNTFAFYRSGWRGINIDATPGVMRAFELTRPRDINLQLAVSSTLTELDFYCWGQPSVFNTSRAEIAKRVEAQLGRPPERVRVAARPLADVLDEYLPEGTAVDLLSVDVEGADHDVLLSNDWERFRPEVVIVEGPPGDIAELFGSDSHGLLDAEGYRLRAWTNPSAIYIDSRSRPG